MTFSFNLAPGMSLGDAVAAVETAEQEIDLPASIHGSFQGTAQAFRASLANEPMLIAAALVTVYIVLGVLYESTIHPITILSTLPSAGVGALLALAPMPYRTERYRVDRHYFADRHRQEERHHHDRFRPRGRAHRRQESEGRDLPGLFAALPADYDDDNGSTLGRAAAGAGIGSRIGTATAPGNCHRRWAYLQSIIDTLHDAGDVSLPRSPSSLVQTVLVTTWHRPIMLEQLTKERGFMAPDYETQTALPASCNDLVERIECIECHTAEGD